MLIVLITRSIYIFGYSGQVCFCIAQKYFWDQCYLSSLDGKMVTCFPMSMKRDEWT